MAFPALSSSAFALRQIFGDWFDEWFTEDMRLVLACGVLFALALADGPPLLRRWFGRLSSPKRWRLRYAEEGRSGRVFFESKGGSFDMYFEFGGGDVLAVLDVPAERDWQKRTGLPLDQRASVLRFIAEGVIRDRTSTGKNRYEIGPTSITIFA